MRENLGNLGYLFSGKIFYKIVENFAETKSIWSNLLKISEEF